MKISFMLLLFLLGSCFCFGQTNVYSFKLDSVSAGSEIDFTAFAGKKILVVNIATADSNSTQLAALEQLYQLYKDSLVIVAVPSNSFGTEPRTNPEIATFCSTTYGVHFTVSTKVNVTGGGAHELFKWLTEKTRNSIMNATIYGSFQKFLINRQGKVVGAFSRKTSPMDQHFRQVIEAL